MTALSGEAALFLPGYERNFAILTAIYRYTVLHGDTALLRPPSMGHSYCKPRTAKRRGRHKGHTRIMVLALPHKAPGEAQGTNTHTYDEGSCRGAGRGDKRSLDRGALSFSSFQKVSVRVKKSREIKREASGFSRGLR